MFWFLKFSSFLPEEVENITSQLQKADSES